MYLLGPGLIHIWYKVLTSPWSFVLGCNYSVCADVTKGMCHLVLQVGLSALFLFHTILRQSKRCLWSLSCGVTRSSGLRKERQWWRCGVITFRQLDGCTGSWDELSVVCSKKTNTSYVCWLMSQARKSYSFCFLSFFLLLIYNIFPCDTIYYFVQYCSIFISTLHSHFFSFFFSLKVFFGTFYAFNL